MKKTKTKKKQKKTKNKTGLTGSVTFFSVDFNPIDTNDFLDIHRCLMKGP